MSEPASNPGGQPIRRIRQACDACRKRKSRCSGERPVCSYCNRFNRQCQYGIETATSPTAKAAMPGSSRLQRLEAKLDSVMTSMSQNHAVSTTARPSGSQPPSLTAQSASPSEEENQISEWPQIATVPRDEVSSSVDQFLTQPDLLSTLVFLQDCPLGLRENDDLLYALFILANACSDQLDARQIGERCRTSAFVLIAKRIATNRVQLPTLQALCVLAYADFLCGSVDRADMYVTMGFNICQAAGLIVDGQPNRLASASVELQGCYWSLYLMNRIHGSGSHILQVPAADLSLYEFPYATDAPCLLSGPDNSGPEGNYILAPGQGVTTQRTDRGIMEWAVKLANIWSNAAKDCLGRSGSHNLPPWAPSSMFVDISSALMDFDACFPSRHRFHYARFADRDSSEFQRRPGYWGMFLFIQFTYHTTFCLLNHPLLLSMRLRALSQPAPYSLIQALTEKLRSHSDWVVHFIDMIQEKEMTLVNPFFGYCALIVASVCLPQSRCITSEPLQRLRVKFNKCTQFAQGIAGKWDNIRNSIAVLRQMQSLEVSAGSVLPLISPTSEMARLLFKLIDYRSVSKMPGPGSSVLEPSFFAGPLDDGRDSAMAAPAHGSSAGGSSPPAGPPSPVTGATWPTPSPSLMKRMDVPGSATAGRAEEFDFNDMSTPMEAQSEFAWPGYGVDQQGAWWQSGQAAL